MSRYVLRPMQFEDIDAVSAVERECFTTPWPTSAYRRELRDNRLGRYIVLVEQPGIDQPAAVPDHQSEENPGGVRRAVGQLLRPFTRPTTTLPSNERIVGFAGMWLMLDEAHVTTIGVKPELRGQGLGELLFATLMEIAMNVNARRVTLECRVSNHSAQALYRKYTFREEGIRRRYYSDNNEDALIMWSEALDSPHFRQRFQEIRESLGAKLGDQVAIRL
jgi:[ribosomal protein S18]-alanine N-acetyltransferase